MELGTQWIVIETERNSTPIHGNGLEIWEMSEAS